MKIEPGLHERLVENSELSLLTPENSRIEEVSNLDDSRRLAKLFLESRITELLAEKDSVEKIFELLGSFSKVIGKTPYGSEQGIMNELRWFSNNSILDADRLNNKRPFTPISEHALFTNSRDEPRIDLELERELATSDSVDIIVSFIKVSGLRLLEAQFRELRDRGVRVRLVTTTYMGATEKKAVDRLVNELGAEVRIDLLPNSNRLHAKAWLFNRESGFSTAIIGSSNMSRVALTSGSEWNVRLSKVSSPSIFEKFSTTFETYWESDDYLHYTTEELGEALEEALAAQSESKSESISLMSHLEVNPRPHQIRMLDELSVSRELLGHSRNLVVAATGTGKTVLAALDYKRLIQAGEPRPNLLFVAHRKEILQQALATFRTVLGDNEFGELLVDGLRAKKWTHVFASIQSLSEKVLDGLGLSHFEHLIVDEFHHAEAKSYKKLFSSIHANQILGLTATPERSDGVDRIWKEIFGGRIASELRLWDALRQDLLAPFHYFGIGEDIDYSSLPWVAGRYETSSLSALVTSNTLRNRRVLRELNDKVADISKMRALVFCASVDHANQVAGDFTSSGVKTIAVTGITHNRKSIIEKLRQGEIQAISTVDVFNEGVDIPEVDTIVLLRPTESPTVFIQQIGRGLRRAQGKDQVLILDFIGAHRAEYRIDRKYEALSGTKRAGVLRSLEEGFPYLPSGSAIQLDSLSREYVLEQIKRQVAPNWKSMISEIKNYGIPSLREYLAASDRDIYDVYKGKGRTWVTAAIEAELIDDKLQDADLKLLGKIPRLLHLDDHVRIAEYSSLISNPPKGWSKMTLYEKRIASMFFWNLFEDGLNPIDGSNWASIDEALITLRSSSAFVTEVIDLLDALKVKVKQMGEHFDLLSGEHPLVAHATYTRYELLGCLGYGKLPGSSIYENGQSRFLSNAREGAYYIDEAKLDLFLVTLQKSERLSPSVRYHDYAISPKLFHWESQNKNSEESKSGQRYINHRSLRNDIMIAVRESAEGEFGTRHFKLLGPAEYIKHQGSRPMAIWWKLRIPMDPDTFDQAAAAKVS